MAGVFISYRRGPTSPYAGRLHDRLTKYHGRGRVFMDVDSIAPGTDFTERIGSAVTAADATLIVIGPDWLTASDAHERRRIDDPADFVHREVYEALHHGGLVIPVLVQGAAMPRPDELPEPLRELSSRNAVELRDTRWSADVSDLEAAIREAVPPERPPAWRRPAVDVAALGLVVVAIAGVLLVSNRPDEPEVKPSLEVTGEAALGGYPIALASTGRDVWVVLERDNLLKRVDARTSEVTDTETLDSDVSAVTAAPGRLWAAAFGTDVSDRRGTVFAVDPETGRQGQTFQTVDPYNIAADERSLWVLDQAGWLDRFDLRTRKRKRLRLRDAFDLALFGGTVWVVVAETGMLHRFDAATGRELEQTLRVGARPVGVAAAGDYVWVVTEQGQLIRVAADGGERESVTVGGEGWRGVATDGHSVWIIDEQRNVLRVDPRTMKVIGRLRLGSGTPQDVVPAGNEAWVLRSRSSAGSSVLRVSGKATS